MNGQHYEWNTYLINIQLYQTPSRFFLIFCLYPFQSKKWRSNSFHERFGKVFQVMDDLCLDFLWSANPWHNLLKINNSCVIFLSKLQHFQIKSRNQNSHKDHEFSKMFNNPPRVLIWQIPGATERWILVSDGKMNFV